MQRRDFIKTIGLGCLGVCCNPLSVFAAGRSTLKRGGVCNAALPHLRLNALGISAAGVVSADGQTWDPGPLLEQYDAKRPARRELYLHVFGENEIDDMLDEMRDRYEVIIPDMPFIGESNFHLQWFIPNSEKLAEYLVVANYGVTKKDFSNLHLMQASKDLLAMGQEQLIAIGKMQFGYQTELFMAATALWSQFRVYPDDYVIYFRRGDGVDFDWGLDYTRCANVQFYKKFDAVDLVLPLICTQDYIAGSAMRTGYRRTMQIATGDPICDLRWKLQE
jgi:hypothetical protein